MSVAAESRSTSMQFVLRSDAPAGACEEKCRTWISASGMIRPETAAEFESFAGKNDIRGLTIALESEGGSVLGALSLGRAIRRLGMTTTVGKATDPASGAARGGKAALSPAADCESMCAFVLLSGVKRIVPPQARVRVHQIWLGDRREDATAAVYSAEDLVLVQRDIGKLAQYTFEMGGTAELLEVSLRIPPWEPMRSLTRDELRRMRLDTIETVDLQQAPVSGSTATPALPVARKISLNGERGWNLVERAGTTVLSRRHPLTIEGEEIGTFDLMIGCGVSAQSYTVTYNEVRRSGGAEAGSLLKHVDIRIGQRVASLVVGTSNPGANPNMRESIASGIVPAAVMKAFAEGNNRSLTVTTASASSLSTAIRIGNTGVAANFPQLAAACSASAQTTHAGLVRAD
jgi:hypothetical protein